MSRGTVLQARRAGIFLMAAILAAPAVHADKPPPFPEFTFKRVKPPKAGTPPRITVQIRPPAAQPSPAATVAAVAPRPSGDEMAWFWTSLPAPAPGMGMSRFEAGLGALRSGPQPSPRLQDVDRIATDYGQDILRATVGTRVSPALALAVITVESGGRAQAVSRAGATGLMQLMPATAKRFGVDDATAAAQNIQGGVRYLDWLLSEFDDPILALAAYNAGEATVKLAGGVPDYPETRGLCAQGAGRVASCACPVPHAARTCERWMCLSVRLTPR